MSYSKEQQTDMWEWLSGTDWAKTISASKSFADALAFECLKQAIHRNPIEYFMPRNAP